MKATIVAIIIGLSLFIAGCTPNGVGVTPAPQSQG